MDAIQETEPEHAVEAGVAWAEHAWGRRVDRVRPLRGGWTSTMLELLTATGERAVLRLMTKEPWRTHGPGLVARESEVQHLLRDTAVPSPTTLAVDPTGAEAGMPAHLMSWMPGRVELGRDDQAFLEKLAALLVSIHQVDPGSAQPREYQSWAPPAKRVVPAWALRPDVWQAAFDLLGQPSPSYSGAFLHRDFHVGNVLWDDGGVSAVVDWVETSWGPRELDVAHCATYLAMLHGHECAMRFVDTYRGLAGNGTGPGRGRGADSSDCQNRDNGEDASYWHVLDVVGYLPDPTKVVQPWRDLGRDISDAQARDRLERRLVKILQL